MTLLLVVTFVGSGLSSSSLENFSIFRVESTDINFRELLAITIALSTWAQHLPRCKILFRCDNEAVVQILNTGVSRNPQMMHLIRTIFYIGACHDFECKAVHIPSEHNSIADSLSRLQWQRFRRLAPHADVHPVLPILMDWRLY